MILFSEALKRDLLQRIPRGLYVCGVVSSRGDEHDAFTLSWMTQASIEPPVLVLTIKRLTRSNELLRDSKVFAVSFLNSDQLAVADHFGRTNPDHNKLHDFAWHPGVTGAPILDSCGGAIECTVLQIMDYGDHDVVIGEVVATEEGKLAGEQLRA